MSDNLEIWKQLSKTDPDQTKGFKRSGGFSGTAVKPIYLIQKMTQAFGPCGIGWAIGRPEFTTVPGPEGLTSVHCSLDVRVKIDGEWSDPIPGVGGDQAIGKNRFGIFVDDEAFKKAFTDAVGNALKFLGMSADIHMGRFDDSKYVADLRQEKQETRQATRNGGYQANIVKPRENDGPDAGQVDETPDDPPDSPPHDPETGAIDDEKTIQVILRENHIVHVATLEEAGQEIAAQLRQEDMTYFESETIIGANLPLLQRMPKKWQSALKDLSDKKKDKDARQTDLMRGGEAA